MYGLWCKRRNKRKIENYILKIIKVYLKVHCRNEIETIACCDEALLNQVFKEGSLKIEITNQFFGGILLSIDEAIEILKKSAYFNIVGENIIAKALDHKLLPKEGIRSINGIPMAMKMMF
jgi:hypothetical protein